MGSLTSYNTCLASCKRGLRWLPGRHDAEARIVAYSEYERYDEDIVDPQESRQRDERGDSDPEFDGDRSGSD
jgi:hypothetical protein